MSAQPILETLAREFSTDVPSVQAVFEMIDEGLTAPFIGRFRRSRTGAMSEVHVRRLQRRREELEELDRRRATVVRAMENAEGVPAKALEEARTTMDRFALEDLFLPHRRPEPEVQAALEAGLGALADAIVAPVPRAPRAGDAAPAAAAPEDAGEPAPEATADDAPAEPAPAEEPAAETQAAPAPGAEETPTEGAEAPEAPAEDTPAAETPAAETTAPETPAAEAPPAPEPGPEPTPAPAGPAAPQLEMTAELAKLCAPYVLPDKGVHTDAEALAGAVRILSDRLGRDSRLRGHVRRTMRKKGILKVKPLVDEKKAGRHKNLLKVDTPLRQVQGHRLTALRQAQKERVLQLHIHLDAAEVLGRARTALGKHTRPEFDPLLDDVATKALQQRLFPLIEEDLRLEIKERSDAEATRFLASHLRQIMVTPFFGRVPVCGLDVSAKGDFSLALVDGSGALVKEAKVEVAGKDEAALAGEIAAHLDEAGCEAIAVGSGKAGRAAGHRVRMALRAAQRDVPVMVVNDAGATSYANGARAREELAEQSIPTRLAMTLARRLQDPMAEFLKVDGKQLGLGPEQRLLTKAALRRVIDDATAAAVAFVGCDFDTVPRSVIESLPGLPPEAAKALADKRDAGEISSRAQILSDGILTETQWTNVAAMLRIRRSPEPLDRTSLHPEQYELARKLLEAGGGSVSETLGRPGATKGLKRADHDVDEYTWRDLMRELSFPGRDPRGRNRVPEFISDATDPVRLQKDRVIEGVVTNVASFGAFIDVGRAQDAMAHVSEIATRYVRDARELLSVGASVRMRILDGASSRMAVSLKDVPSPGRGERSGEGGHSGGGRAGAGGGRGRRRGGRGRGQREEPKGPAGRIWRRDGAAGAATSSRRGGARRGGPRRGGSDRFDRGERVDLRKINAAAAPPSNNPFANFFKKDDGPAPAAPPKPKEAKAPKPAEPKPAEPTPAPPAEPAQGVEDPGGGE